MKTKTLILSSANENQNARAIVTLSTENGILMVKMRLYSHPELNRDVKIAVYHDEQVYSANLINRHGYYESSLVGDYDFNKDFYIALIDTQNNNDLLLSGSTYAGYFYNAPSVFEKPFNQDNDTEELIDKAIANDHELDAYNLPKYNETSSLNSLNNPEYDTIPKTQKMDTNLNMSNQNENLACDLAQSTNENKCEHCKYKEYFYKNEPKSMSNNEPTTQLNQNATEHTDKIDESSLTQMVSQFDYVFNNYPQNNELNNLIEGGKFVTIREGLDNYAIGAIYEQDQMKYICYAVRTEYNTPAPQELGQFYQWLPIDKDDPLTDGYYIVFQDAKDLKIIKV